MTRSFALDTRFTLPPPPRNLRVSVAIPVRDEALLLPAALQALAAQVDLIGRPLDPDCYEVLVLANNCSDGSAAVTRQFARENGGLNLHVLEVTLPVHQASIGFARRLVMDETLCRVAATAGPCGIIASTDGDTAVAPDWLAQIISEVEAGADAVGGFTTATDDAGPDAGLYADRDSLYHHLCAQLEARCDPDAADPWPRHHQFFGANMAVTAHAYCQAGRLPTVSRLEDVALATSLRHFDARIRHSPHVRATTSARLSGRVPLGLATQLQEWSDMSQFGLAHYVEDPEALHVRFCARADLRRVWRKNCNGARPDAGEIARLADTLCVPIRMITSTLDEQSNAFGLLWELVLQSHQEPNGKWAQCWPLCPIMDAITKLRRLVDD